MRLFKTLPKMLPLLSALLISVSIPAFASITVNSPYNGSTVGTTFALSASSNNCSNQPISAMGYSLDNSPQTTIVNGTAINQSVYSGTGGHTLHVKAWGTGGASCVSDVALTVSTAVSNSSGGDPSIASPSNGASVNSPFSLSASSANCYGQPTVAIGYSVDNSSYTYIVNSTVLNATVTTGAGGHTIHVKSWGNGGAGCVSNLAVNVGSTTVSTPSGANNVSNVQATVQWNPQHDTGATGSASGWTGLTNWPSRTGSARHFATSYWNYGGERYEASFGDDVNAHNFVYDGWLYIQDTAQGVANVETDLNQVIGNGWTVIMGFQCDGWSGTWDYTVNAGSATNPVDHWVHSGAGCNPRSWGVNAWHHVQIAFSRDDSGYVTYQSVTLDGHQQWINAKAFSGFALGWGQTLITNLQVDGGTSYSSGSNVYLDDLTISRW